MCMETKKCSKCGRELPLSEFHKFKRSIDGHQAYCKQCRKMSGNVLENVPTIMLIEELYRRVLLNK